MRRVDPETQRQRKAELARLVAGGLPVHHAGQRCMGLTKGQTARLWANIKRERR